MAVAPLSSVPRATFARHSAQLQRRFASSSTAPFPDGLFKPPSSVIKPWKAITGAREWQTSAYHYNKHTTKNFPVASTTADKLLRDYATMVKRTSGRGADSASARNAIAARRKTAEKMYVSGTTAKDYGDRIVINAFMYDEAAAAREEKKREKAERDAKRGEEQKKKAAAAGAGRRRPVRTAGGARRIGGAGAAAYKGRRNAGVPKAAGAGR